MWRLVVYHADLQDEEPLRYDLQREAKARRAEVPSSVVKCSHNSWISLVESNSSETIPCQRWRRDWFFWGSGHVDLGVVRHVVAISEAVVHGWICVRVSVGPTRSSREGWVSQYDFDVIEKNK